MERRVLGEGGGGGGVGGNSVNTTCCTQTTIVSTIDAICYLIPSFYIHSDHAVFLEIRCIKFSHPLGPRNDVHI